MTPPSARERLLAFRRTQPRTPHLEQVTVRARGLEFAVWRSPGVGEATPLLCINGGLLYGHDILWPALAPLAQRRQLILYDQRGRGQSEAPPGPLAARIEHDAGDVRAIREALGIDRSDVLGHSWGGGIALLGAAADPGGTRRLVLADSVGPTSGWLEGLHERALARLPLEPRSTLAALSPQNLHEPDPARHSAYARAFYPAWFADQTFAQGFTPPLAGSRTGAAVAARLRREGYDWRPQASAVVAPALVLHGMLDVLPPDEARRLISLLPNAKLEVFPDCGHMPFWEAPAPFFARVESFLTAD